MCPMVAILEVTFCPLIKYKRNTVFQLLWLKSVANTALVRLMSSSESDEKWPKSGVEGCLETPGCGSLFLIVLFVFDIEIFCLAAVVDTTTVVFF